MKFTVHNDAGTQTHSLDLLREGNPLLTRLPLVIVNLELRCTLHSYRDPSMTVMRDLDGSFLLWDRKGKTFRTDAVGAEELFLEAMRKLESPKT